jgi:hypothetical protein
VAGWLFLGSLRRADSFTFQATGSDQCKFYTDERNETCPFFQDNTLTPCLCDWDDPWPGHECTSLSETLQATMGNPFNTSFNTTFYRKHPRYWQHRWYEGKSSDADEVGNRLSSTYDNVDYWANTTNWWNDTSTMPGAYKESSASGYTTTYDRVRVLSALSVADFPLYNYYAWAGEKRMLGTYAGLEADGMFIGFSGCESYGGLAHFRSGRNNNADEINATLCPKGSYGFDARCRGW